MPNHIVQGSDPEFSIANSEAECVPADRLLSGSQLGCDGRSDTGELRPSPGDVHEHVANLRGLIDRFANSFPDHIMLAGSRHFRQPLGGHIHFSGTPVRRPEKIVQCLDVHLSIPLLMLENKVSAQKRRREHDYGHLGQWRNQSDLHGGFEYRTPSSWLVSENIANMTLEIAMLIAYDYQKLLDQHGNCFVNPRDDNIYSMHDKAEKTVNFQYNGRVTNLHEIALESIRKLKKLPNAPKVMNSILTLENAVEMKLRWHHEIDCTTRWHLSASTYARKKIEWEKIINSSDDLPIHGNAADYSCLDLVQMVKTIIGAVGLSKRYYIYGLQDKYGKDLAISYPFDAYTARVQDYVIAEKWYGRARERAPSRDCVLIGVSKRNRNNVRRATTSDAIARIIRCIEGI